MRRYLGPLFCSAALGVLGMAALPAVSSAEDGSPIKCARATTTTTTTTATTTTTVASGSPPPAGSSCWEAVAYPFGVEGEAVDTSKCAPGLPTGERQVVEKCYLTVTSLAFRAPNRGLAATRLTTASGANPFGVWIFNGQHWYPAPGFPGSEVCKGNTIVWAGKLDYWLVGGEWSSSTGKWADLCRFDGEHLEWEPLEVPESALQRVTPPATGGGAPPGPKRGTITSAACFAWNSCWFFGTYGTVLHWGGQPPLIDVSPNASNGLLWGEYTAAVARQNPAGARFGLAAGATSEGPEAEQLQTQANGEAPAQLYGSGGQGFSALAFTPFTIPLTSDPFRTDLVAVDLDAGGQGWVAANPAGLRLREREGQEPRGPNQAPVQTRRPEPESQPQPAPLEPVSAAGAASACSGPPAQRFTYTPFTSAIEGPGAFLWSSIAVIHTGEALAGGQVRRAVAGEGPNEDTVVGEPVIARAGCDGTTTVIRFRIQDPTVPADTAPADREGAVTAIAANAPNDAWAATSRGGLTSGFTEPPQLYRLTNGQPPEAPEGNDLEERPPEEHSDPVIEVLEPPPPQPPPEPTATVNQGHTVTLPAAVYDIRAKLHTTRRDGHIYLSLHLTFKLRRAVTIGAQALRKGRVVSVARPRHFTGRTGSLILRLDRKHWPTKVHFIP